jgi:integrase
MRGKNLRATFLEDKEIRRWYDNLAQGSLITATRRVDLLREFHVHSGVSPGNLAKMPPKDIENLLADTFAKIKSKGGLKGNPVSGAHMSNIKNAVVSWLQWNDVTINARKIKIRIGAPHTHYEQVPTHDDLRTAFSVAPIQTKVAMALMAFGFVRPEVLGYMDGSEGLLLRDFVEVKITDAKVTIEKVPTMVSVREELSKAKKPYFTFLPLEACEWLKTYLEVRLRKGERLTPETPLFAGVSHRHMRTDSITDSIRRVFEKAGLKHRPYVLRAWGATQMDVAESQGLISHGWRQFLFGHKGDIESRYSTNKRLPQDVIESMLGSYAQIADRFLSPTAKQGVTKDELLCAFNRQFLAMSGYTESEIAQLGDLSQLSAQQVQEYVKRKSMRSLGLNGNSQKVVSMKEVKSFIAEGWEYVSSLPNDEAIIRLPQAS